MKDHATEGNQSEQTMLCTSCWTEQPRTEFRRRCAGSEKRHCQCRECRNREERELRVTKTQKRFLKYTRKANRADFDPFIVVAVTCELTKHFGGVDKFCARFVQAMKDAESARNHAAVSSYLGTVIQLSTVSSQMIEKSKDYSVVSTEDLKRQAERQLVELVRSQPEIVHQAARQVGWKLVPPDEVGED